MMRNIYPVISLAEIRIQCDAIEESQLSRTSSTFMLYIQFYFDFNKIKIELNIKHKRRSSST